MSNMIQGTANALVAFEQAAIDFNAALVAREFFRDQPDVKIGFDINMVTGTTFDDRTVLAIEEFGAALLDTPTLMNGRVGKRASEAAKAFNELSAIFTREALAHVANI